MSVFSHATRRLLVPYRSAQAGGKPVGWENFKTMVTRMMARELPSRRLCKLSRSLCLVVLGLLTFTIGLSVSTPQASAQAVRYQEGQAVGPVTGWPIPRFVSIRPSQANVRVGPGRNYDVQWTFVKSGMPVEITAEFGNWRKIRDLDGDEGWIRHDLLAGQRTAVVAPWSAGDPIPARQAPQSTARTRYLLEPGVLALLRGCDGEWCEIASANQETRWAGYVRQNAIWGAYPQEEFEDD